MDALLARGPLVFLDPGSFSAKLLIGISAFLFNWVQLTCFMPIVFGLIT